MRSCHHICEHCKESWNGSHSCVIGKAGIFSRTHHFAHCDSCANTTKRELESLKDQIRKLLDAKQ